jgi:hypothetical protein
MRFVPALQHPLPGGSYECPKKRQAFKEKLVPGAGIEPAWCITPRDFKSITGDFRKSLKSKNYISNQ